MAAEAAAALAVALFADAWLGEPEGLYRRLPHPVVAMGRLTSALDRRIQAMAQSVIAKRAAGVILMLVVVGLAAGTGALLQGIVRLLPLGWVLEGLLMSTLLAQRSLVDHVRAVAAGLRDGLAAGRRAVSRIVGRDPERLDRHAVARAAIESLAENLSDGVVAPLFWAVLLGLPGMLGYKALNTLDSMVGHRTPRHLHVGWASARLDDLANLVPARLTTALLVAMAPVGRRGDAVAACRRDARRHRSPNAGWPEAAMAGALGLRIAGPRSYGGVPITDAWMGDGRAEATPADIEAGIRLAWLAWALAAALAVTAALLIG
jgi:adenosylcobinamide-phosphate synthase